MTSPKLEIQEDLFQHTGPLKQDFCQICQFPFKLIRILTPESHIVKCKRRTITPKKECEDGISCMSSMESHYQIYSHGKLRKHRSEFGSSNPSTPDSSNGIHKLFQSLHGFDSKISSKLNQTNEKKKIKSFSESFVDLTDTQSSEEFKSSQSSSRSYNSINSNKKKIKSSPLTSSNSANTSHFSTRARLGKHKLDFSFASNKNKTIPPSQTEKVKKTSTKLQKVKIEKTISENPWSIASSSKMSKTEKTENIPFPQSIKKPKKTPIKKTMLKIKKPITENPWTITSSQVKKLRTPMKKPLEIIDLTHEDSQSSTCSKTSRSDKNAAGDVCNKGLLNSKSNLAKKVLFPTADKRKIEISSSSINLTSSGKRSGTGQNNKSNSSKDEQIHHTSDLSRTPFIKLERISPEKYPQVKQLNSNPSKSLNHDKKNRSNSADFRMNDVDVPFHSTQIPGEKTLHQPFVSAESLDTQDSEEWSIPFCRGPGFVPFSPINGRGSSRSPPGLFVDSDNEKSINIDMNSTKNEEVNVDKNENYIKISSNLEQVKIENSEATQGTRNPSDKFDLTTTLNCENLFDAEKTKNFDSVKGIGGILSDIPGHGTNATDNGSDTTLGDGSDASDDDSLECSLLMGLSQSKTLPFSQINFTKPSDIVSTSETDKTINKHDKNDVHKLKQCEISDTISIENVKEYHTGISDATAVRSSESEVRKVEISKSSPSDSILCNGVKSESSSNWDLLPKKSDSPNQAVLNDGASTSHQHEQAGARPPSDKFENVEKWINSSSDLRKQGDIGSMLFGLESKIKEVPEKVEAPKEVKRRYNGGFYGGNKQRTCPFYKKVSGTDIAVDAFSYGVIEGIQFYFLSHFHADHYMGLSKKHWKHKVLCSQITGNLVSQKIGLSKDLIICLPMLEEIEVGNVSVTLLEANHCPGAVLFLFKLRNNKVILHTGDFRANDEMESTLKGIRVDTLYLDTTYLNPEYQFPLQARVINAAVTIATASISKCPKTLVAVGTYLIGKERIFAAIAKEIKSQVFVSPEKYRTVQCLEDEELKSMVTRDPKDAKVHVLQMRQINLKNLKSYLSRYKQFDQLVAIKPTGWTHNSKHPNLNQIVPVVSGQIKIYGLPYSEHSSFEDLRRFVKFLRPARIIPTVNVGRKESREMMNKYLDKWKRGLDP